MEISLWLQALDFTEVGVAKYTSYARPQAVNGRLASTLSFSERQGKKHFSLNQNPIAHPDRAR